MYTGVTLICLALCADGAIGNVQEKALKMYNGSNSEMVCITFVQCINVFALYSVQKLKSIY